MVVQPELCLTWLETLDRFSYGMAHDKALFLPTGSDEMKKKMYSCIIVVGGGMNFEGAQPWLQYRIWVGMQHQYRLMLETMDVITRPKVQYLLLC